MTIADLVYALATINIILAFCSAYTFIKASPHSRKVEISCLVFLFLAYGLTGYNWREASQNPEGYVIILLIATICTMVLAVAPRQFIKI
ncbi:MAG: hypothetical protein C3F02_02355 [Parcubacteria group bacterium]|nr:MAG: hypothetical protein C3F02_02355 [Parcubacteria group bacterium]